MFILLLQFRNEEAKKKIFFFRKEILISTIHMDGIIKADTQSNKQTRPPFCVGNTV